MSYGASYAAASKEDAIKKTDEYPYMPQEVKDYIKVHISRFPDLQGTIVVKASGHLNDPGSTMGQSSHVEVEFWQT